MHTPTRFELIDLARRIEERGLQLRRVPPHKPPAGAGTPPGGALNAEPLTQHEVAVILAALHMAARP